MATYYIFQDFGDFTEEGTCEASNIMEVLDKLTKEPISCFCEMSIRLYGKYLAGVTVDSAGNWTAEVLRKIESIDAKECPGDLPYKVTTWNCYILNNGKWIQQTDIYTYEGE